jgi:DNA primase catalytic subunit
VLAYKGRYKKELDMAKVEERKYEESEEFDIFHTDRNIVKRHISFKHEDNMEDEEAPKRTSNGGDIRDDGELLMRLARTPTP